MKTKCSTYERPVLKAFDPESQCLLLYQPLCRQWSCPECSTLNMYQWAGKIAYGVETYQKQGLENWRFLTLTSNPKLKTKNQTLFVWPKAWGKFSARMRRKFPGIRYCLIPETHKDGRLHIHMLASHGIGLNWIKKNAFPCGMGYQAKSKKLYSTVQAANYATKYLKKGLGVESWPKDFRRVRTSHHWPEPPAEFEGKFGQLNWVYFTTYPAEGLDYLAMELERISGLQYKVIS